MEAGGAMPAGSGRAQRLDPLTLPVRFPASDAGADGQIRQIELHRERVILRRAVRGMRMTVGVPVAAFLGVSIRAGEATGEASRAMTVSLEHRDRALSIPLFTAADSDEAMTVWQSWARTLDLPPLIACDDGTLLPLYPGAGQVRFCQPACRKRRRTAISKRHPRIMLRRQFGGFGAAPTVHRGEREIIARN